MFVKMKLKRAVFIFGVLISVLILCTIYSAKDLTFARQKGTIREDYKDVSTLLYYFVFLFIYLFKIL